jgi:hypothetical protein
VTDADPVTIRQVCRCGATFEVTAHIHDGRHLLAEWRTTHYPCRHTALDVGAPGSAATLGLTPTQETRA